MKRLLFLAFISTSIFFSSCVKDQGVPELIQAVPVNAVVVMEWNHPDKALKALPKTELWKRVDSTGYLKTSFEKTADIIFELTEDVTVVDPGRVVVSFHESGANSFDPLFVLDRSEHAYLQAVYERWAEYGASTARTYNGSEIFELTLPETEAHFYAAEARGIVVFSPSDLLIEDALRQLSAEVHLLVDPTFAALHRTANQKDPVNIYIQYAALSDWAQQRLKAESFSWLERGAEWTELDVSIKEDRLLASGLTQVSDSVVHYLSLFRKNPARKNELLNHLPNNTAAVLAVSFENFASYQRDYEKLLRQLNKSDKYLLLKDQESKFKAYTSWVDTEYGLALLENQGDDWRDNCVGLIKFRDKQRAEDALATLAGTEVSEYGDYTIRSISKSSFPTVFGTLFQSLGNCYYTLYRDYVVIAPSVLIVKQFLNDNRGNRTLSQESTFSSLREELNGKSHVFLYAENPQALSLLKSITRPEYAEGLTSREEEWNQMSAIAWQFEMEDDAAHTQLILQFRGEEASETRLTWATELDSAASVRPFIVKNHYSKRFEVLVQDDAHTLYMVDHKGDILWRRGLNGPINGAVQQVDRFKNGKLQFVFNTENTLYMLDRNGRDVEDYPITLPSAATANVSVFDYDQNRKYRLFIGCGERVLLFDVHGKPVSGWEYKKASSTIVGRPQLIQLGRKDYLAFFTADGGVTLRNRRGQERVKMSSTVNLKDPELFVIKGATLADSRLVGLSATGQLTSIFLNGTVDVTDIGITSSNARLYHFKGHQIVLEGNEVRVSGPDVNYSFSASDPLDRVVYTFDMGPHFAIGLQSSETKNIWLLDATGQPQSGFPVPGDAGMTIRDLDLDGKLELITLDSDGYVYNYSLD